MKKGTGSPTLTKINIIDREREKMSIDFQKEGNFSRERDVTERERETKSIT